MTGPARRTSDETYFESFHVGDMMRHARGRTITEADNTLLTLMVLNTAQAHFNEEHMFDHPFGQRVVFGGVTAAMVIGLTSEDTSENSLAELELNEVRFSAPVLHGDTLYAYTEVLATADSERPDAGIVRFRHWGINQDDVVVFTCTRAVLVKRAGQ